MSWETVAAAVAAFLIMKIGFAVYARLFPIPNLSTVHLTGKQLASDNSLYLVDIRTPSEWKETGVIKGAHLLTFGSPASFLNEIRPKLGPDQKLALICRSGNRSGRAARKVAKMVNWDVVDVSGGMSRIVSEGYRTVAPKI